MAKTIKPKTARRWLRKNYWKLARFRTDRDLKPGVKFNRQHKLCLRVLEENQ